MDWFLYDNGLRHERVNQIKQYVLKFCFIIATKKGNHFDRTYLDAGDIMKTISKKYPGEKPA